MAKSFDELIQQIKQRLDILEVVSEEVILKKSGSNWWGLCPFHKEKSPSFSVSPSKGFFKCFGCGEGGDALTFLMKIRGMEFGEIIRELAEKYNLEIPNDYINKETKDQRELMMKACEKASEFYTKSLFNSSESENVLTYLGKRGLKKDVIEKYSLGWAHKETNLLYLSLKKDFSIETLEKAGLVLKGQGGEIIDRFRNRIIIPIRNEHGQYVAFGARAVEDGQNPKYLNSSDSLVYNKGKLLYGLYYAKEGIKEDDSIIIMEGYFDVISAQAHGIKNCVASCGTSLTSDHIKLISRYSKSRKIYLSFDTDAAGINATQRGAQVIKDAFSGLGSVKQFDESYLASNDQTNRYSCEIRVIAPPEGKDPDEFIRTVGADSFKKFVEHAPLLLDFQLNAILKHKNEANSPIEKTKLVNEIIPILKEVKNEIIRSEYIKMVATTLIIDESALIKEINKSDFSEQGPQINVNRNVTKTSSIEDKAQKNLLSLYLVSDSQFNFQQIKELIGDVEFSNERLIIVKTTIDKLTYTVNNVRELIDQLYTDFIQEKEIQAVITDLICISETFNNLSPKDFQAVIEENINRLEQCSLEQEKVKMRNLYKDANNDEIEALKIQMQLRDKLNNRLRTGDN